MVKLSAAAALKLRLSGFIFQTHVGKIEICLMLSLLLQTTPLVPEQHLTS